MSDNKKKILAENIKNILNSPDYVAMPDLITYDNRHGDLLAFLFGSQLDGNIHKKENWICSFKTKINPEPTIYNSYEEGPSENWVSYNGLEKEDWSEIVSLIQKRNEEKEQLWNTKLANIEQKLNQQPDHLYYYWGKGELRKNERADCWFESKGMRGFATFLGGNGNGLTHNLYIAEEHPVLDNFSFQPGFYLIKNNKTFQKLVGHYEGGFGCSGGETNPNNWKKYLEAHESVEIIPYQVRTENEKPKPVKKETPSQPKPLYIASTDKIDENYLKELFQKNKIKSISLNGKSLKIEYQNNASEIYSNQSLQRYLIQNNQREITSSQLFGSNVPTSPSSNPSSFSFAPYLIGAALGIIILGVGIIAYHLGRKTTVGGASKSA